MNTQSKNVAELVQEGLDVAGDANAAVADQEQIQLFLDDDVLLTDEESEALIKAHNDALDGKVESEPGHDIEAVAELDDSGSELSEGDAITENDVLNQPFFGFDNARSFVASGQTMSGIIEGLRKPPVKSVNPQEAVEQGIEGAERQSKAALEDDRINLGLGKAAMLMGGLGLMKLGDMIGSGSGLIGSGIGKLYNMRQERALGAAIGSLDASMEMLRGQGMGQLDDKGVSLADRQSLAKQFFSQPENKAQLDALFDQADKIKQQARLMIDRGIKNGDAPDVVMDRVLEPMRRFTEKNEPFLESIKLGNDTLLDKMDNAMNSLFEMIKQIFQKLAGNLGIGTSAGAGSSAASTPRMG